MYLIFFIFFFAAAYSSFGSADSVTIYEDFVRCFRNDTNISDKDLSDIVLPHTSVSFTPTLRAYIRNARFNTSSTPKPSIIIVPRVDSHVQAAVICTKTLNFQLKIRSGGHDYDGLSYVSATTFFVLDLSNFRNITVEISNDGRGSAWVQTGATLGELFYRIWEKSEVHAFPAGICPTVGVGGHVSGGGYGHLIRKFGLTVDHVIDATIVDVNGKIHDRKSMGEDLFWALRGGGGGSFGVVLNFKINLVEVPKTVTVFRVDKSIEENALDMVYKWQFVAPRTDPGLFIRILLSSPTKNKTQTVNTKVRALYLGKADDVVSKMAKEFPELGLKKEDCIEMTWLQSLLWWMNQKVDKVKPEFLLDRKLDSSNFLKRKSDYVEKEMTKDELKWLFQKLATLDRTGLVLNPYGGNLNATAANETAFPHRHKLYKIQHSVTWSDPGPEADRLYVGGLRTTYNIMTPFVSKNPRSAYLNYRDVDIGVNDHGTDGYRKGEIYGRKYFGENFDRLVRIKTAVDPKNFFRHEQSIPTLPPKRR